MSTRLAAIILGASAWLFYAAPAWACPSCALNDKGGLGSWFVLAGMILFPFAVVGVTVWTLKRLATGLSTETEGLDGASETAHLGTTVPE